MKNDCVVKDVSVAFV